MIKGQQKAYDWLKERFPNQHPLGSAVGIMSSYGWVAHKYLPPPMDEPVSGPPVLSRKIEKRWVKGEKVSITRFDENGCYVQSFPGEEILIPFNVFTNFIKTIKP